MGSPIQGALEGVRGESREYFTQLLKRCEVNPELQSILAYKGYQTASGFFYSVGNKAAFFQMG